MPSLIEVGKRTCVVYCVHRMSDLRAAGSGESKEVAHGTLNTQHTGYIWTMLWCKALIVLQILVTLLFDNRYTLPNK